MQKKKVPVPTDIVRRNIHILQKGIRIHRGDTRRCIIEGKPIPKLRKESETNG
jgi:hypothetical protein